MATILVNSTHITDTINNSTFTIKFNRSMNLTNRKIALTSANLYFSWKNITWLNNTIHYTWIDDTVYTITLPEGFYEISDIYSYMQYAMRQNNHYLVDSNGDTVYYIEMVLNSVFYSVDILTYAVPTALPEGWTAPNGFVFPSTTKNPILTIPYGIHSILGYSENFQTSSNEGNGDTLQYHSTTSPAVNPTPTVLICCDQCQNEFSDIGLLYSLSTGNTSIGGLISQYPPEYTFLNLRAGSYDYLSFRILNPKSFLPMEIRDAEINLTFAIQ